LFIYYDLTHPEPNKLLKTYASAKDSELKQVLVGQNAVLEKHQEKFVVDDIPDDDDLALKSSKKVKVFGNRFAAVRDTLNRYGKGNYIKGAARLMGANKSRVAAGLGILGAGGLATAYLGKKTMESFGNVKSYNRKSKSGKIVKVNSYKRK